MYHLTTMEPGSTKAAGNLTASSGVAPEPKLLETLISTPLPQLCILPSWIASSYLR